ncbi:MAG: serine/threonine-protein kinase [Planctomycetia bacterium]|nr:serine/threonine-protein kinase [Planctomycetia bacterium]
MGFLDSVKKIFGADKLDVKARFEIKRAAISGTMSGFYLVEERATKKAYGLKIIDMKKLAEVDARFGGVKKPTEGEISVLFDHPYIVKTLEYGVTTKGENYLLMEYLGGGGLNVAITSNPEILEGKRLYYLRQGATALQEVHDKGFIHRDICPRNFILTRDLKTMKLTDFGLSVPATPQFMQAGNRTGTPNYMAPELIRRKPTNIQLDVFSFGVTAYETMTGRLPWSSGADGRAALTHDSTPTDIRTLRPQIHPMLARAIHQCIEPDQAKRFPSMKEFLQLVATIKKDDVD